MASQTRFIHRLLPPPTANVASKCINAFQQHFKKFSHTPFSINAVMWVFCLPLLATSSGCSYFQWPADKEKLEAGQAYWFHYEAARRGGILVVDDGSGKSKVKMCAEPPPDVALTRTIDLIAKGAYQGATGELQAKLAEQLAQLSGRTQNVLILRESLFRLCELSINSDLTANDIQALYKDVIDAAVALATKDAAEAKSKADRAATDRIKAFDALPDQYKQQFLNK